MNERWWLSDYAPPQWVVSIGCLLCGLLVGAVYGERPDTQARSEATNCTHELARVRHEVAVITPWAYEGLGLAGADMRRIAENLADLLRAERGRAASVHLTGK